MANAAKVVGIGLVSIWLFSFIQSSVVTFMPRQAGSCTISFGDYKGSEYITDSTVGLPKCLVQSRFLKVQQHRVRMPPDSDNIIDDWLWIDYHDRINVLVEAPVEQDNSQERHFYVFEQSKYALESRNSIAIVGGIIEPGEQAEQAAQREVAEEMHVSCLTFKLLGRFRTDVNRGMGWTNSFLALDCKKITERSFSNDAFNVEEVGVADTERQDLQTVPLSKLRELAAQGKFLEIQWTATVATALLQPELQ